VPAKSVKIGTLVILDFSHKMAKKAIMDPVENPYSPGAASPPPELAGRDKIREQVRVAIARIRVGNAAKSVLMVGLRGVGKTVLLDQMRIDAEWSGIHTIRIEAPENKSLPAILAPQLRLAPS
jgi:predicted AAA+ superfamily ATPase